MADGSLFIRVVFDPILFCSPYGDLDGSLFTFDRCILNPREVRCFNLRALPGTPHFRSIPHSIPHHSIDHYMCDAADCCWSFAGFPKQKNTSRTRRRISVPSQVSRSRNVRRLHQRKPPKTWMNEKLQGSQIRTGASITLGIFTGGEKGML